jgi:hypothetical protein
MKDARMLPALAASLALAVLIGVPANAQDQSRPATEPATEPSEVAAGTRFLVGLQETLSTKNSRNGDRFRVKTLEPLYAADGTILPSGTQFRGHVDRVDAGQKTGRARMWLTFDDVKVSNGRIPLVADVFDVPGVHSLKVDYNREGGIEVRNSSRQQQAEAAAAGAFAGAAPGVVEHSGKDAAMGAAAGAATAFMVASGLGQELTLERDTKLELILDRPLRLGRN